MSMFVKVAKTHDLAEEGMVVGCVGDTEICWPRCRANTTL
jgi:hypothetical protein